MLLTLRNNDGAPLSVRLSPSPDAVTGTTVWSADFGSAPLNIYQGKGNQLTIEAGSEISSSSDEIAEQVVAFLSEAALQEAAGIEFTDDSAVRGAEDEPFPYDPENIRVDTKPFNISLVFDMIEDGDINLSPDFQRQFVWTDTGARSRLIESIMLRIPLPVFYMAQDSNGRLQVVDGLQRLTVIRQFLKNELRLRDLEYLKQEEGKVFKHSDESKCIDQRYRKRILQTQIMMNIIDPQTPSDVKFDIFKRINQGGRPLNSQEIRNCMSSPSTRELIGSLANSEAFESATCGSVGKVRMQDQDLVLRFIAFRLSALQHLGEYQGNMDRFLDHAIDFLNTSTPSLRQHLAGEFHRAMANCKHLFGEYAFRKCLPQDLLPGARRRLINNALFTAWSNALALFDLKVVARIPTGLFAEIQANALVTDPSLLDSVTSGTNDRRRLSYTMAHASKMCKEHLK